MGEKTCCVTGHRDIPAERIAYVEQELRREIQTAIEEDILLLSMLSSAFSLHLQISLCLP